MSSLRQLVSEGGLFQGYAYGYPHKMAYRALSPGIPLSEVWKDEDKSSLFLYAHIPFCEMRCGFCNLFTTTGEGARPDRVTAYLDALERQVEVVRTELGEGVGVARMAVGGGTPTFLSTAELQRLFGLLNTFARAGEAVPISVEMSPETVDAEKLGWLRNTAEVTRASLGVQSFVEAETKALGRPQSRAGVERAIGLMREAGFPVINLDLIYGSAGQTWENWRTSLEQAHAHRPQELFLYPLYVRPMTGLGRRDRRPSDHRDELYRQGRDWLLERGYRQVSMRLFRSGTWTDTGSVHYCCQEDGMVGLGAGARSYSSELHYSTEWAVGKTGVLQILESFTAQDRLAHATASHGCRLDREEQQRRHVIKSILRSEGLELAAYRRRFGSDPLADLPLLEELLETGAATLTETHLSPTQLGLEWGDVIGPWLYSEAVRDAVEAYELR